MIIDQIPNRPDMPHPLTAEQPALTTATSVIRYDLEHIAKGSARALDLIARLDDPNVAQLCEAAIRLLRGGGDVALIAAATHLLRAAAAAPAPALVAEARTFEANGSGEPPTMTDVLA